MFTERFNDRLNIFLYNLGNDWFMCANNSYQAFQIPKALALELMEVNTFSKTGSAVDLTEYNQVVRY